MGRASATDVDALLAMCAEHVVFERATLDAGVNALESRRAGLCAALGGTVPRLRAWLALADGEPIGYASAIVEYSTWEAREYLHLDCLFVRSGYRGANVGAMLLDAVLRHASEVGLEQVQWQTPDWNDGARRFYRRTGASESLKARFSIRIGPGGDRKDGPRPPCAARSPPSV